MTGIPDESLFTAVGGYASDAVGCSPDQITAVTRFEDGNRHAVYKVSYLDAVGASKEVVIRVSHGGEPADCAQAEREARVLKKVGGVAARLLYDFRCTGAWFEKPAMCMQFVPGRQRELSSVGAAEIARLGSVVAWVHEQPIEGLVEGIAKAGNVASYAQGWLESIISRLAWVRDPLPAPVQARLSGVANSLERSLEQLRDESFQTYETLALLHGDIGTGNILWAPDPVLIDWEYTRLGDPADEIAYLFDQNGLSAPQREAFWRGYREGISRQSRLTHITDRVEWWEPVTLLGSALWWVERWVRRNDADTAGQVDPEVPRQQGYYFDHVIRRLDRFDKLLVRQ
jgi:aminoglycoside phosphotransferase (APT) family kinase protein